MPLSLVAAAARALTAAVNVRKESATMWHTPVPDSHPAAKLLTANAVRTRSRSIMAAAERGETRHLAWRPDRIEAAAAYVADTIRQRYPGLDVPYHSRWRYFEAGGVDRWAQVAAGLPTDRAERARTRIDLAITSVLLDAGAGGQWRYVDAATGTTLTRSEGLAVAGLRLFAAGAFSARPDSPYAADAHALARLDTATLARGFQVAADNPLVGLDGRAALLRRLGVVAAVTPAVFGAPARLGHLYDYLAMHAVDGTLSAGFLLETLLRALEPICRRGSCSMAWRWATVGGIRRRAPRLLTIPPLGTSRSTSSRSGSRIRCWSRSRTPDSRSPASTSSRACRSTATAA